MGKRWGGDARATWAVLTGVWGRRRCGREWLGVGEALGSRLLPVTRLSALLQLDANMTQPSPPHPRVRTPASGWRESCLQQKLFF